MEFVVKSETALNEILNTQTLLEQTQGDYGCDCIYHDGDLEVDASFLYDENFYALCDKYDAEVGTIAIKGNLVVKGTLTISDRLMLLFVTGNIVCDSLINFATEVYIGGALIAESYQDHSNLLRLQKETAARKIGYGE